MNTRKAHIGYIGFFTTYVTNKKENAKVRQSLQYKSDLILSALFGSWVCLDRAESLYSHFSELPENSKRMI